MIEYKSVIYGITTYIKKDKIEYKPVIYGITTYTKKKEEKK